MYLLQESESEDEGDEEIEDEPEPEPEAPISADEPAEKKTVPATSAPKDTERQLSKKELKKKGLEELDALLAELGISGKDGKQEQPSGINPLYNTYVNMFFFLSIQRSVMLFFRCRREEIRGTEWRGRKERKRTGCIRE